MKTKAISYLVLGALLAANLSASSAQGKSKARQEPGRARAMFIGKKADGLEVKLTTERGELVDPGKSFKAGDRIRVSFESNFKGFVYFINVSPGGVTKVIYSGAIEADQSYDLPAKPYAIEFDKEPGTEILKVVLSYEKIKPYEEAIENSGGELGKSATSVAEELADNSTGKGGRKGGDKQVGEPVGIVSGSCTRERGLVLASGKEARCRGIVLASGNRANNEGSVVAISDKQGSKLNAGEVAVFELRLKHL
ncbi:MAG TPA: DUF4384 domain-containing protein [Blastocatellia bacterium]|nr:DUF4384 domain-containing protein [Blastocatellia bacterium]